MKLKLILSLFLILLCVVSITAATPDIYLPITTSDNSLSATVFATGGVNTMDISVTDGELHVSDSVHGIKNLRILESMLEHRIDGYNGNYVQVLHKNDMGVIDSSKIVKIDSDGTWTYFYDVEFSEVIIGGFVGTYEITQYNLTSTDQFNMGEQKNGSEISSLVCNITPDYTAKTNPYDINTTGLVGWWKFDDDYLDSSGNGNNGTANGTHFVNGKYNNASQFDGVDDYVDVGTSVNMASWSALSVSVWVKYDSSGTDEHTIISNWQSATTTAGILLRLEPSDDTVEVFLNVEVNTHIGGTFSDLICNANEWHLVTITYDTTNGLHAFLDGIKSATSYASAAGLDATASTQLQIGNSIHAVNDYFTGSIDQVCIYNRALSAEEIQNNYYDQLQQFQINTTANLTLSTKWDSTANNPLAIPYGAGELFTYLNFTLPESVVQDGITIYDYPTTASPFDATALLGWTDDTTKISETASNGLYELNITHSSSNTGEGYINYTTVNTLLLNADFTNSATLSTNNPNATMSGSFNISTGYVSAGVEYCYIVNQTYFYPPTNLQTTSTTSSVNVTWDAVPNADKYSIYQDLVFVSDTTNLYYNITGLTHYTNYSMSVSAWNATQETSYTTAEAMTLLNATNENVFLKLDSMDIKLDDLEIQNESINSQLIMLQLLCVLNFVLIIAVWRRKEQ